MYSIIEMLGYMRPQGSDAQQLFCERFIEPPFGKPEEHGNYILQIGQKPKPCFTAHHDTVHRQGGMQKLVVTNDIVTVADPKVSSCLGADCTSGIYVILSMIEAGIEGTYVIHAAEEVGCKGSMEMVRDYPMWLTYTKAVISFDRYGDNSVITHQMGFRTASDAFANSFADALNMPQLKPDTGGSYTDSNEYAEIVPECTNISVGYYSQHSTTESQDLAYLEKLVYALENADWSKLVYERDPTIIETINRGGRYGYSLGYDDYGLGSFKYESSMDNVGQLFEIVVDNPFAVAELLDSLGMTPLDLMEECKIDDPNLYNKIQDTRYSM